MVTSSALFAGFLVSCCAAWKFPFMDCGSYPLLQRVAVEPVSIATAQVLHSPEPAFVGPDLVPATLVKLFHRHRSIVCR